MAKFQGREKMKSDVQKWEAIFIRKAIIRNCHQKRQMIHQSPTLIQNQYQNDYASLNEEANFLK